MAKLYIVGDIHGCREELRQLLNLIDTNITRKDTLVFLGDYVDRGPDSCGVIQDLIDRKNMSKIKHVFLKGNHEDMLLNSASSSWLKYGGKETLQSYGNKSIPKNHEEFFNNLELYYQQGGVVCVHAGINPNLNLKDQKPDLMLYSREHVNYNGTYKNNEFVVFGHSPSEEPIIRRNHVGIDTGCVFGGYLTCLVCDAEKPRESIRYISVKSSFSYI
jgi:serine/threonine protein phosphatase 1